jgi:hypothetical protein
VQGRLDPSQALAQRLLEGWVGRRHGDEVHGPEPT